MVTFTFDILALLIGLIIGLLGGAVLVLFVEMHDGGAWDRGWHEGYNSGLKTGREFGEVYSKPEEANE